MIKVVDAIMGSGKTCAAINFMNEHPNQRFVYITPFLDEATRIATACPALHFVEPTEKNPRTGFSKVKDTQHHISYGRNIASTHQAFLSYSEDLLRMIREQHYTLMIDESVNVLEKVVERTADMQMAIDSGYIVEENGTYRLAKEDYDGKWLNDTVKMLESHELNKINTPDGDEEMFYWTFPVDLLMSFENVIIMTYMFNGYDMYYHLRIRKLPFSYIGIRRDGNEYHFDPNGTYIPSYVGHIHDMIDICQHKKLNWVGNSHNALSMSWFKNNPDKVKRLKLNILNYYQHVAGEHNPNDRLWGTYKDTRLCLQAKGYTKRFLIFNSRSTNKYRDRHYLVYAANLFVSGGHRGFYKRNGIEFNESKYALSIMIQWIWRSAIRDGEKIHIYIPSRRMRELLVEWINGVEAEYNEYQRLINESMGVHEEVAG